MFNKLYLAHQATLILSHYLFFVTICLYTSSLSYSPFSKKGYLMHLRVPAHINIFSGALVALPSSTLVVIQILKLHNWLRDMLLQLCFEQGLNVKYLSLSSQTPVTHLSCSSVSWTNVFYKPLKSLLHSWHLGTSYTLNCSTADIYSTL